jgi:hypothetical protein
MSGWCSNAYHHRSLRAFAGEFPARFWLVIYVTPNTSGVSARLDPRVHGRMNRSAHKKAPLFSDFTGHLEPGWMMFEFLAAVFSFTVRVSP